MVFVRSARTDIIQTQQVNASNSAIYHARLALNQIHPPAILASQAQHSSLTLASRRLAVTMTAAALIADREITMYS